MEDTEWAGPLFENIRNKYDTDVYSQEDPTKPTDPDKPIPAKAQTQASDFFNIFKWLKKGRPNGIPKSDPKFS